MMNKQTQHLISNVYIFHTVLYHLMLFKIFKARKFGMGFIFGVNFWRGEFLRFWFLPPFDHPRHLKCGASPLPPPPLG